VQSSQESNLHHFN
jgi:hypothetical protein